MKNTGLILYALICILLQSACKEKIDVIEGRMYFSDKGIDYPMANYEISIVQRKSIHGFLGSEGEKSKILSGSFTDSEGKFFFEKTKIKDRSNILNVLAFVYPDAIDQFALNRFTDQYGSSHADYRIQVTDYSGYYPGIDDVSDYQYFAIRLFKQGFLKIIISPPSTGSGMDTTFVYMDNPYLSGQKIQVARIEGDDFAGTQSKLFNPIMYQTQDNIPLEIVRSKNGTRTYTYDSVNINWKDTTTYTLNF